MFRSTSLTSSLHHLITSSMYMFKKYKVQVVNTWLLIVVLFMLSRVLAAQSLLQENRQWHVYTPGICLCGFYTEILYIEGDTLIHNKPYKTLWRSDDSLNVVFPYRYLREEAGKVFMYNANTQITTKLYDFTKTIGDTVHITNAICEDSTFSMTITAMDSVAYNGIFHQRWYLQSDSQGFTDEWIEGIGSVYGLVYPAYQFCSKSEWTLWCLFQDQQLQYKAPSTTVCYSAPVGIAEIDTPVFYVQPNPVYSRQPIYIRLKQALPHAKFILRSFTGIIHREVSSGQNYDLQISTEGLSSGVYLLQLIDNKQNRQTTKIMIL